MKCTTGSTKWRIKGVRRKQHKK